MPTPLAQIKDENWREFRRVARRYERELRRIRNATACSADQLRWIAATVLTGKKNNSVHIKSPGPK